MDGNFYMGKINVIKQHESFQYFGIYDNGTLIIRDLQVPSSCKNLNMNL